MLRLAGHRLEGSSRMGMEMKDSSFGRARSMEYYSAHGGRPRTSREAKGVARRSIGGGTNPNVRPDLSGADLVGGGPPRGEPYRVEPL